MFLTIYTIVHTLISLIGIFSGLVMLGAGSALSTANSNAIPDSRITGSESFPGPDATQRVRRAGERLQETPVRKLKCYT